MNYIGSAVNCAYSYFFPMQPDNNVRFMDSQTLKSHLPVGIDFTTTSEQNAFYVFEKENYEVVDASLERACHTIIVKNVHFAALNLNQETARYGTFTNSCRNKIPLIKTMLQNPSCYLEYLDLSYSSISLNDAMQLVDSLPIDHTLKCMFIGGKVFTTDQEMVAFANWLSSTQPKIAIIGTHLKGGGYSSYKENEPQSAELIDSYYKKHFPDFEITELPTTLYPCISRVENSAGNTYH
jgi:hypothetical protein